jgi:hypothetical protein
MDPNKHGSQNVNPILNMVKSFVEHEYGIWSSISRQNLDEHDVGNMCEKHIYSA